MIITNRSGLPESIVEAVKNDPYNASSGREADFSVTTLAIPSRIYALRKKNWEEITEDASDRLWSLLGQIGHGILERAGTATYLEKRLYCEVGGKVISGQVDVVNKTSLEDFKFCSRYVGSDGIKEEWISQQSCYRLLCERNGIPITDAKIVAIYRDWSLVAASRSKDYPQKQVEVFDVPLWSLEGTEAWIISRIQSHENALKTLPECTNEEKWQKPAKVAVMVKGQKRAKKLLDTKKWAEEYIVQEGLKNAYLEDRPSEPTRCLHYCPVSSFCETHKQYLLTQQENTLDSQ